MKKLLFLALLFTVISCNKEIETSNNEMIKPKAKLTQRADGWHFAKKLYKDCETMWCSTPPVDCEAFIVFNSPSVAAAISSLDSAISSGPTSIQSWFLNTQVYDLFPNIHSDNLSELQTGSYYIYKHVNGNGNISYFIGDQNVNTTNYDMVLYVEF